MQKHLESLFNCTSTGARVVKTEKGDYIVYDSPVYNYHLATLLQKTYPNMQISVNAEPSSLSGFIIHLRLSSMFNEIVWPSLFGALFIVVAFLQSEVWYPWCATYLSGTV